MKTSEFGKKMGEEGFTVNVTRMDITFSKDGINMLINFVEEKPRVVFGFTSSGCKTLTPKQWTLINSYLQTKPENRKDERKWVIPLGNATVDGSQTAWIKGQFSFAIYAGCDENWRNVPAYQFTDSEVEQLKSTQTEAIAKTIDIAKELVSDEA